VLDEYLASRPTDWARKHNTNAWADRQMGAYETAEAIRAAAAVPDDADREALEEEDAGARAARAREDEAEHARTAAAIARYDAQLDGERAAVATMEDTLSTFSRFGSSGSRGRRGTEGSCL
jgi:hypothetical protein